MEEFQSEFTEPIWGQRRRFGEHKMPGTSDLLASRHNSLLALFVQYH